jgi:UDP-glucose 4-epimerase
MSSRGAEKLNSRAKQKAVVIGGAGFMGSHTSDELSARGYDVTIFDIKPSPWLWEDQQLCIGDMMDVDALARACEGARYVYHCGGVADIQEAKQHPYATIEANVMGVAASLEAAVRCDVERFVYASTMYVYSAHGSFYRASKQAAETVIRAYVEHYAMDYNILRYGSLYGPRAQRWNGLQRYVETIVREGKITYAGTGHERREYIHVSDAARLSVDILDEKHRNKSITVTGHQVLESRLLMDMIFEIAGLKPDVTFDEAGSSPDHYTITPYRFSPDSAVKLVPDEFVDIGQGIMDIVQEISNRQNTDD